MAPDTMLDHWSAKFFTFFKRYDQAIASLETVVRKSPNDKEAWSTLGWLYSQQKNMPKAVAALERAVALDPGNYAVHFNLGFLQQELGHGDAAIREFDETLRLKPT